MITILALFAVGVILGMRFHWGALLLASGLTVSAVAGTWIALGNAGLVGLMMLAASLCALQGGYLVGAGVAQGRG